MASWGALSACAVVDLNVLDRFHITANVNKAVDKVRAEEARAHGTAAPLTDGDKLARSGDRLCVRGRPQCQRRDSGVPVWGSQRE